MAVSSEPTVTCPHDRASSRARFSIDALGVATAEVVAIEGEERIGSPPRFRVDFLAADVDLARAVGSVARLSVMGRALGGVVLDMEAGETERDGRVAYTATFAARAMLLGRGRRSRVFEAMTAPEILARVAAESGVPIEVDARLSEPYLERACTTQHRESDLDLVARLAEREGISVFVRDDGDRCTLSLTDRNDALPHLGPLEGVAKLRRRSALLPSRVDLVSVDPTRPDLPLRASAVVAASGAGELEVHDVAFSTPEEGARAAELYADSLRSRAVIVRGEARRHVGAGARATIGDREVVVFAVSHAYTREDGWTSAFEAIPASARLLPEHRAARPKVEGFASGRLSPREAGRSGARGADGLYNVRGLGADADRLMPMVGGAFDENLAEGTPVVWTCIDGDPDRPLITAILRDARSAPARDDRAKLRGPGGSFIELGGAAAADLGDAHGELFSEAGAARAPEVTHHATSTVSGQDYEYQGSGTGANDTWMRFAVPHTDGSWSYSRLGEAPQDTITSSSNATFGEDNEIKDLALNTSKSHATDGVFEYTKKDRTEITEGNYEVLSRNLGRIRILGGNGSVGSPYYDLNVDQNQASQTINSPYYSLNSGESINLFTGTQLGATVGLNFAAALGGYSQVNLGFGLNTTVGYLINLTFADSYDFRLGEALSDVTTQDTRARDKIQLSIRSQNVGVGGHSKEFKIAAVGALAGIGLTTGVTMGVPTKVAAGATMGVVGALAIAGYAYMRAKSKENELEDGDPILSLQRKILAPPAPPPPIPVPGVVLPPPPPPPQDTPAHVALRSDDWAFMMCADWMMFGKNKGYTAQKQVDKLLPADLGTGISMNEQKSITIQADAASANKATITLEDETVTIIAKTIVLKAPNGDATINLNGNVTVTGTLAVNKDLTVDGNGTITKNFSGNGGNIKSP